jgi:hypothetical protein
VIEGKITTELVIDRHGKVGSRQVVMLARGVVSENESGARQLGRSYWIAVEQSTHGLVRRVRRAEGGNDLCLLGRGPALLRLGPAQLEVRSGRVSCRYCILGGILARRAGGCLTFNQSRATGALVSSTVIGFHPRLGRQAGRPAWSGALYPQLQARLHHFIGRRWLTQLIGGGR